MLLVTLNSKPSSRLWEKVKLKFLDLQFILSCIQLIYCSVIFKCKIIAKISFCYIEVFYFRYSTSSLNECKIIVSIKNKLKFNNKEKITQIRTFQKSFVLQLLLIGRRKKLTKSSRRFSYLEMYPILRILKTR